MLDLLAVFLTGQIGVRLRRFARLVAFAAVALLFGLIAIATGFEALFLALAQSLGPIHAALILAGVAAVLALLASIPLWRRAKAPPPSAAGTLVELALAVALGLLAKRKSDDEPTRR